MIKALIRRPDGTVNVVVGLSRLNLIRLLEGKPIQFALTEIARPPAAEVDVTHKTLGETMLTIVGGETEAAIVSELTAELGPPTSTIEHVTHVPGCDCDDAPHERDPHGSN